MNRTIIIPSPIGPIKAPPGMSEKIYKMSDEEFCAELNRRPFVDPFTFGAWMRGYRGDRIKWDGHTFTLKVEAR